MFLLGSFLPATLADRIGRRKPMIWGSIGCGISMMIISVLLSFKDSSVGHATATASVAFFFTVRVCFMHMLLYASSHLHFPSRVTRSN
jgi:MFS family permease